MRPCHKLFILLILSIFSLCCPVLGAAEEDLAVYEVTATRLNIRTGPTTGSSVAGALTKGTRIEGVKTDGPWIRIYVNGNKRYISSDYVSFIRYKDTSSSSSSSYATTSSRKRSRGIGLGGWLFIIFIGLPVGRAVLGILWEIFRGILGSTGLFYIVFYVAFLPFRILNWMQIFLHKPWRFFQRYSWPSESIKPFLRVVNVIAMIPLYIVLTPLRFANAVAFNMILRPLAEFWNYLGEVISPSSWYEGRMDFGEWLMYLPIRILKYPIYHGALTLIECALFTVIDTIYPAYTLYHGTSAEAAGAIVICPNRVKKDAYSYTRTDGVWNVGGGNYAGDGIYFAPRSRTSMHYARYNAHPVMIICRVSIGRLLPLSLAPWSVFHAAGHPNAHAVTSYGLNNGYVTIEWWRADQSWWEYCLLDWKNKYNESWRIRPVMVLNLENHFFNRVKGGSRHWLFDRMMFNDFLQTIGWQ